MVPPSVDGCLSAAIHHKNSVVQAAGHNGLSVIQEIEGDTLHILSPKVEANDTESTVYLGRNRHDSFLQAHHYHSPHGVTYPILLQK